MEQITDLDSLFRQYTNKNVLVYIPGGNKGDGLIYYGGRHLFRKYKIKFKEIDKLNTNIKHNVLFVYGCGGYNKIFCSMPNRLNPYFSNFKKIYILPSSFDCDFEMVRDFITNLPNHVTVFCREKYSFDQVQKYIPNKENLKLDHDLALFGDYSKFIQKGMGTLLALRTDKEKLKEWNIINVSKGQIMDVSKGKHFEYLDLLNTVKKYDTIITDRAHVSIAAAMLGKKLYILPNNYHKLKGIYEYSLKDKPNIQFCETDDFSI